MRSPTFHCSKLRPAIRLFPFDSRQQRAFARPARRPWPQFRDHAVERRDQHIFHLHRFQHQQALAALDRLALATSTRITAPGMGASTTAAVGARFAGGSGHGCPEQARHRRRETAPSRPRCRAPRRPIAAGQNEPCRQSRPPPARPPDSAPRKPVSAAQGSLASCGSNAAAAAATAFASGSAGGITWAAWRSMKPVSMPPRTKSGSAAARARNAALVLTGHTSTAAQAPASLAAAWRRAWRHARSAWRSWDHNRA